MKVSAWTSHAERTAHNTRAERLLGPVRRSRGAPRNESTLAEPPRPAMASGPNASAATGRSSAVTEEGKDGSVATSLPRAVTGGGAGVS